MVCFAKKSNKSKGSSANDESEVSELPDVKVFDTLMGKRISFFKDELVQVRGGSVSKDMLNSISVSAYGSKIPIEEAGQVSLKTSTSLSISVFDAALNPFVMAALRDAGMNLNPVQEGNTIIVSVPKPSKEAREVQVKLVSKMAEKTKQEIRQIRKDGLDSLKRLKGKVSDDDVRRLTKNIEAMAETNIDKVVKLNKEKEKELLSS